MTLLKDRRCVPNADEGKKRKYRFANVGEHDNGHGICRWAVSGKDKMAAIIRETDGCVTPQRLCGQNDAQYGRRYCVVAR